MFPFPIHATFRIIRLLPRARGSRLIFQLVFLINVGLLLQVALCGNLLSICFDFSHGASWLVIRSTVRNLLSDLGLFQTLVICLFYHSLYPDLKTPPASVLSRNLLFSYMLFHTRILVFTRFLQEALSSSFPLINFIFDIFSFDRFVYRDWGHCLYGIVEVCRVISLILIFYYFTCLSNSTTS